MEFGAAAMRLAGVLARVAGWAPDIFWNATPAEAAMVLGGWRDTPDQFGSGGDAPPPPDAALLAQLMEQFPDG